jgi:CRISPR/Cas system-associated protein Csm6
MGAEKLSISLDSDLVASVRAAASEQGVSVSTWLAEAARAQVRQRRLREALDVLASEEGELEAAEIDRVIADARRTSRMVVGTEGAA